MRKLAYLLILSIGLVACSSGGDTLTTGIRTVGATEAQSVIDEASSDLMVLDVRTPEEFAEGHLANAVNIDFYAGDFSDQLAALDPETPYVLYCRSGNRSATTAEMMEELGFADVTEVDGGILAWEQAGLPITR